MSNYEANDAYVALQDRNDSLETELAATKAELAEANAVIERVRRVRDVARDGCQGLTRLYRGGVLAVTAALDRVEGL